MMTASAYDPLAKPSLTSPAFRTALLSLLFAGTLTMCSGCENSSPGLVLDNGGESGGNRCDELLNSAVNMLQPDRLGISSDRNAAVTMLNDWLSECAPPDEGADKDEPAAAPLRQRLSAKELDRVLAGRFDTRDAGHIRNCFLHKATVDFAARSATNDVERVVELFYYVARNVALVSGDENAIPRTPYEILLLGRGTAEDRAWVFADLLRQIRIDTVVLHPGQPEGRRIEGGRDWLIGVLLNGEVYLFDPRRGLPVPAAEGAEDAPLVRNPATLAALQEGTVALYGGDAEDNAPEAPGFQSPAVGVVGNSSFWAPRTRVLQMALSGERAAIVYDGLQDSRFGDGLLARVSGFTDELWASEDVFVWSYPEEQCAGFHNLSDRQQDRLRLLMLPFDAPVPRAIDRQSGEIRFGRPERKQLKTRMEHLLGRYGGRRGDKEGTAIRSYLMIRGSENFPQGYNVDSTVRRMHARAAEDAFYWKALCQFEKGEYEAAAESFRNYLDRYQPDGLWTNACRYQLAIALAKLGRSQEAVKTLQAVPDDAPQHAAAQALLRRWTESGEQRAESQERRAESGEQKGER